MDIQSGLYSLYEKQLRSRLSLERLPCHVAVMCDGNRRWAREAGFEDVSHGHRAGAVKIAELLQWCDELSIELATIYLLSTENLQRDSEELDLLLEIIASVVEEISAPDKNWHVRIVGRPDLLPEDLGRRLQTAAHATVGRTGTTVNVAVGYGGRQEIVDATQNLVKRALADGLAGEQLVDAISVDGISSHLYTSGQPDPDLIIRTSGEQRLSGFLLWQTAYAEIWFTDAYWPAFRRVDFLRALRDFSARSRRFGT